jgi:hypothetical protein
MTYDLTNIRRFFLLLSLAERWIDERNDVPKVRGEPGRQGRRDPDPLRRLMGFQQGAHHPGHGAHRSVQHVTVLNLCGGIFSHFFVHVYLTRGPVT